MMKCKGFLKHSIRFSFSVLFFCLGIHAVFIHTIYDIHPSDARKPRACEKQILSICSMPGTTPLFLDRH